MAREFVIELVGPLLFQNLSRGGQQPPPPPPPFAGGPELAAILHYLMRLTAGKKRKKKRPSVYDLTRLEQLYRARRILKAVDAVKHQSNLVRWSITSAPKID